MRDEWRMTRTGEPLGSYLRRWGFVLAAALCGLGLSLLTACGPKAQARGGNAGLAAFSVTATVAGDTIRVRHDWRPGPDDGAGNPDFWIITTGTDAGAPKALKDSVQAAFAVRTYTKTWAGNPPGTYTGYGCGKALRRGTPSTTANCRQWTAVVVDVPPPPPVYDSLGAKVTMLRLLPDSFDLHRGTAYKLCLAAEFPDGGAALWAEHAESTVCQIRLANAYPTRRALTEAESAYLFASENCYPTDGQNPANGTICKKRGTPS